MLAIPTQPFSAMESASPRSATFPVCRLVLPAPQRARKLPKLSLATAPESTLAPVPVMAAPPKRGMPPRLQLSTFTTNACASPLPMSAPEAPAADIRLPLPYTQPAGLKSAMKHSNALAQTLPVRSSAIFLSKKKEVSFATEVAYLPDVYYDGEEEEEEGGSYDAELSQQQKVAEELASLQKAMEDTRVATPESPPYEETPTSPTKRKRRSKKGRKSKKDMMWEIGRLEYDEMVKKSQDASKAWVENLANNPEEVPVTGFGYI